MGSSYALHVAYRTHPQLAGVFSFSPFLNYDSEVYTSLADRRSLPANGDLPKLLCIHGDDDDLMLYETGVYVFRELTRLGVSGEFHTMPGVKHEIRLTHLKRLEQWARHLLPPLVSDLKHRL